MNPSSSTGESVTVELPGDVVVTLDDHDRTRPYLLLHGGGGVATVTGFADPLAARTLSRVLVPTHPGFGGTPKAAPLHTVRDLAATYVALLDHLGLSDVTVIGNSFGGWVAVEVALLGSPRVTRAVVVDGIGIEVDGHPMANAATLSPAELMRRTFYDPSALPLPPPAADGTGPSPDTLAMVAYGGPTVSDPTLLGRLARLDLPVQVVWGAADGIVDPDYGRAFAAAIPGSTFTLLPHAGHLPQVEAPEQLLDVVTGSG